MNQLKGQKKFRWGLTAIVLAILLTPAFTFAQEKIEREYSIKPSAVPEMALKFTQQAFDGRKVRWYAEESQKGKSIEAKVKQDATVYSVEFDQKGNLLDVEVHIKFRSLPEPLRKTIMNTLETTMGRVKIHKIQRQWTGATEAMKELITDKKTTKPYTTKYELVIRVTKNRVTADYEILMDEQGKVLRQQKISRNHSPHLLF